MAVIHPDPKRFLPFVEYRTPSHIVAFPCYDLAQGTVGWQTIGRFGQRLVIGRPGRPMYVMTWPRKPYTRVHQAHGPQTWLDPDLRWGLRVLGYQEMILLAGSRGILDQPYHPHCVARAAELAPTEFRAWLDRSAPPPHA